MSKFTFILGLAGSGKSFLASEMKQNDKNLLVIDDAFHPNFNKDTFQDNLQKLHDAVFNNYDAVIIEGAFCFKDFRDPMVSYLRSFFHSVQFEWICFEKDLDKANKNLHNDDRKNRNPEQHEKINDLLMENDTLPDNCKIIPIFEQKL